MKNNVTSVSIPVILSETFPSQSMRNALLDFINTSATDRKALSVGERNFEVKNVFYQLKKDEIDNREKRSIRLTPSEKKALAIYTDEKVLWRAVTVALCAMRFLDKQKQTTEQVQKQEPLKPASPEMGQKKWFLDTHKEVMTQIKRDNPACTRHIEPFMGSGILGENMALYETFDDLTANDLNEEKIKYFETLRKYPALFKSIITCLDYATSPEGESKKCKMTQDIMDSIKQFNKNGEYWVHTELLDAMEYLLKKNKIMKLKKNSKKKEGKMQIKDESEKEEKICFFRHPIQWVKQRFGNKNMAEAVTEPVPEPESPEPEQPLSAKDRISAAIDCVSEWKQKRAFKTTQLHPLKLTPMQKLVDDIGRESSALQKIEILNQDAMKIIRKNAGNPNVVLVCDPPYWDCWGYDINFNFEHHKEMAKLLQKHAKAGGFFLYFGRPTAPRSLNTNACIDYSLRDKVYEGKFDALFNGKGFFYHDYEYDKAHGVIERVVSNFKIKGFSQYGE